MLAFAGAPAVAKKVEGGDICVEMGCGVESSCVGNVAVVVAALTVLVLTVVVRAAVEEVVAVVVS